MKKEYDDTNPLHVFQNVYDVITDRKANPKEGSYTNYLFDKGIDKILKKSVKNVQRSSLPPKIRIKKKSSMRSQIFSIT